MEHVNYLWNKWGIGDSLPPVFPGVDVLLPGGVTVSRVGTSMELRFSQSIDRDPKTPVAEADDCNYTSSPEESSQLPQWVMDALMAQRELENSDGPYMLPFK